MRLAQNVGLDVAEVEIRTVERPKLPSDQAVRPDGGRKTVKCAGCTKEDFCQAMGYTSAQKYAADGGPVFRDCFALLRRAATRPALEVLKMMDAALFNLIIGNADAHGKNYSLLYQADAIVMAPLYDLLSTVAYSDLSPNLAMKIAKRRPAGGLVLTRLGEVRRGDRAYGAVHPASGDKSGRSRHR